MGKRTIRKKRNTRKRNTFKRKKNTLKKYTLKRKKINLRKLGGSPRAEPKPEPKPEPAIGTEWWQIMDSEDPSHSPPESEEEIRDELLLKRDYQNTLYGLSGIDENKLRSTYNDYLKDKGKKTELNDLLTLYEKKIDECEEKKYEQRFKKLDEILIEKEGPRKALKTIYKSFFNDIFNTDKEQKLEDTLNRLEKEIKVIWLKNKKSSFFERSLLCMPPSSTYEEGTIEKVLEDLRGGEKYGVAEIDNKEGKTYYSIISFNGTEIYRWKDLEKLSKTFKNLYKRTYNYKPLEKGKSCYERIIAINDFFNQDLFTRS